MDSQQDQKNPEDQAATPSGGTSSPDSGQISQLDVPASEGAAVGSADADDGSSVNLELILDIPVGVSVELGRTQLEVSEVLQLGQGSVLELEKLAGEQLEVLVQGRPIGRGEVVVVNEKFGIRLTDIISPAERVAKLG